MKYCMLFAISLLVVLAGGYFAFRYFALVYALRRITCEIDDIRKDLEQNQIVHLPLPDRHLAALLSSFNAALEDMQKERQKYVKQEKEFQKQIENISHDLRTPLTVILGYLKYAVRPRGGYTADSQELLEAVGIVAKKAEFMKHLVAQFYDYSRLHAGDFALELGAVDVPRVLRESLMGNYQVLEQAQLDICIGIPEYPIWAVGETAALERIFLNLFQNAGRYASTYLNITVEAKGKAVAVVFCNDTQALSEEDIPHLFERFYKQEHTRNKGGTGLGLTIAQELAKGMGAQLNVTAVRKGEGGSCFEVCFTLDMKAASAPG